MRRAIAIIMLGALWLGGCAHAPDIEAVRFASTDYARAFQAAKDVLRRAEFELDRVDARAGVITTQPRASAGLATPWIRHGSGMDGWLGGLMHHEVRIARVIFESTDSANAEESLDLRTFEGPMSAKVQVTIRRLHRPGRQVSPTGIRLSSVSTDTTPGARLGPDGAIYRERADDRLSARLMHQVQEALDRASSGG